jgi:hypothetical protein
MAATQLSVDPMWTHGEDTVCLLIERDQAPRFEICVLRGADVLRQHRLFARTTAEMVADAWHHAVTGART